MRTDVASAAAPPAIDDGDETARATVVDRVAYLDAIVAFALGFSLQFNVITATFGLPFARLSDLVPFIVIPYFSVRTNFLARALDSSARLGFVLMMLVASVLLKSDIGPGDLYMTLILMVYLVQALQIVTVFGDRLMAVLCAGLLIGYIGSVVVLIATGAGLDLAAYGLGVPPDSTITPELTEFLQDKLGGLWAAGNQTGHIFAAAGAAAFCLSISLGSKLVYLLYFAGLLVSFPLTNNRAGLIVPLIALAVVMGRGIKAWQVFSLVAAVGIVGVFVASTGILPLPGFLTGALEHRLYSDSNLDANLSERLMSGLNGVALLLRNPFGIGNVALENELLALTGVPTPHNGIVSLGLQSGVLIALLYVVSVVQILIGRAQVYGLVIYATVIFSTPSMLFEQLTATQYFLFLIALVLAAWVARGAHPRAQAAAASEGAGGADLLLRGTRRSVREPDRDRPLDGRHART